MNNFTPIFKVTETESSILACKYDVIISNLNSNQKYQVWLFNPECETMSISENDENKEGCIIFNLHFGGAGNSRFVEKGIYTIGINDQNIAYKNKMNLNDWLEYPNNKKVYQLFVNYPKPITTLKLTKVENIPWGTLPVLTGQLWFKDEQFLEPNGATWFMGRKIHFTGNDIIPQSTFTDEFSQFSIQYLVRELPKSNYWVQAYYDGDTEYFEQCDSNIIYFDVIRHTTNLSIGISHLIKKFRNTTDTNENGIIIHANEYYTISGYLIDSIFNIPISKKIIDFKSNPSESINSVITDNKGYFSIIYKIPNISGSFIIKAKFIEDERYLSSEVEIKLNVVETNFNLLSLFKKFKAFDDFIKGFEDSKELPQIRSAIWLLSILGICSIPLGLYNRPGESIQVDSKILNYSLDIIANVDEVFVAIDCTTTIPDNEKIDKIFNTAQYLTSTTNQKFIPVIVSNAFANFTKEQALKNKVIIIDRTDITEILNYILTDEIEKGNEVFLDKLKL